MPANGILDLNLARLWERMNEPLSTATALTLILPTWKYGELLMPANGILDLNLARLWERMNEPLSTATALTLILPTWRIW